MIRQRLRVRALAFLGGDVVATLAAFFVAWHLRFEAQVVPLTKSVPDFARYLDLLPIILVVWPVIFYFHGLYQTRRSRSTIDESLALVVATLLAALILSSVIAWYRPPVEPGGLEYFTYSRAFLGLFTFIDLFAILGVRLGLRIVIRRISLHGDRAQQILVVGAGHLGREITEKLTMHRELGFRVVGFLDDDPGKAGRRVSGLPVLGAIRDLGRVLEEERIDQVFIALPLEAHRKILRLLQSVEQECVEVRIVPDILQYATLKATMEDLDGVPVINLSQVPLQGWGSLVKRLMDLGLAALGLGALLPFFPLIALAIWLEDRGPILYCQERMGLDGRSFMIWKFRSMRANAEDSTGPVWATRDDSRRTFVGEFLRRTSIDELPQLWNVLKGEMSLVGPRPERPVFVQAFKQKIPQYMLRHRVKAGITGWAQVHGWRGNTSIKKRLQYDLYYIENWSILLDLKILWMTVRQGFRNQNAY